MPGRRGLPRPLSPSGQFSLLALLWAIVVVVLAGQIILYLAHAAAVLPYPFDLDQGEGYDVNAGWLLSQGRQVFTDNASYPYFSSNYPPVYAMVVAVGSWLWGPSLTLGRAVSVAATLMLAALIGIAARARGGPLAALLAVGLFFLSNYVFHTTVLARVNSLTGLLALTGLVLLDGRGRVRLLAGLSALLAALFCKPTAVDAALAGLVALAVTRRCEATAAILLFVATSALVAGALEIGSGGAFALNVFRGNVNPFIPEQLWTYLGNFALLHAVTLLLATVACVRPIRRFAGDGVGLYLATGSVVALGVGKWGAGESYFLSAITAACVLAGGVAERVIRRGGLPSVLLALAILTQATISAHGAVSARLIWLPDRGLQAGDLAAEPTQVDLERGHAIVTRLRAAGPPNLLEEAGFGVALRQEVVGNATHLRNLQEAGAWDASGLVADLVARRYHTVVLHAELYPEPVLRAIGTYYFLYDSYEVHQANYQVFLPGAS